MQSDHVSPEPIVRALEWLSYRLYLAEATVKAFSLKAYPFFWGEERCIISQLVNYYMLPADALPPVEAPAGRTR